MPRKPAPAKLTRTTATKATRKQKPESLPAKSQRSAADKEPATPNAVFVDGDEWQGVYVDGVLVEENHQLRTRDVLKHFGLADAVVDMDEDWVDMRGSLPE